MSAKKPKNISIDKISESHCDLLQQFFEHLSTLGEEHFFSPHPFTRQEAARMCRGDFLDYYCLARYGETPIAYGMLRGWDEGYEIPSLGITVRPDYRGLGVGVTMMQYLHLVAKLYGAKNVRLKVKRDNIKAKSLYEDLGYDFKDTETEYLIGLCALSKNR